MPDFYLVMDIVKPVESFAMWPQMITQECVPDASCLHDWWLPDGCLGEGRKRYRFSMFLSNKTPWSSGEGRHMMYKRRCSWRGEIKQRTSGKPYTIVAFSALSQIMVSCIPKSRKAGRRGKPGCSHPGRSCIFAQHKGQQNPLQESQWGSLLGQMHPSGSTSLLGGQAVQVMGQGCCQLVRVLPCMKGTAQLCSYSGWPEGPQSLQFRFSHSIPLSIGNVIHTTFTEQENIMKMPADMND